MQLLISVLVIFWLWILFSFFKELKNEQRQPTKDELKAILIFAIVSIVIITFGYISKLHQELEQKEMEKIVEKETRICVKKEHLSYKECKDLVIDILNEGPEIDFDNDISPR
ncbi:hypothetical protein [Avibacterium paragallinarum]|uniref:Uncharacterized protein n=1 Tax=Avibacterium paragallinarum TaxID=728 RepID=A0ABU7QRV0_AVIPA|nr:hypothetical protein [Avibacterium paragallinarum]